MIFGMYSGYGGAEIPLMKLYPNLQLVPMDNGRILKVCAILSMGRILC